MAHTKSDLQHTQRAPLRVCVCCVRLYLPFFRKLPNARRAGIHGDGTTSNSQAPRERTRHFNGHTYCIDTCIELTRGKYATRMCGQKR